MKVMTQEQIEIQLKYWENVTQAQLENLEKVLEDILNNSDVDNRDLIEDLLSLCQDEITSRFGGELI